MYLLKHCQPLVMYVFMHMYGAYSVAEGAVRGGAGGKAPLQEISGSITDSATSNLP